VKGTWVSPHARDPFAVSPADKAALLLRATAAALGVKGVKHAKAGVTSVREDKIVLTSEGSRVHQIALRIVPELDATAVDRKRGRFAKRDHEAAPMLAGWEYVEELDLPGAAPQIATEALQKLHAPPVEPGKMNVILAPSNLWLTIHESVGHPTELDRALGLEANFAGTSFLKVADTGKLGYGSDRVHLVADRTQPGGLATVAWDDECVASQRWDLVRGGKFVGWQTTREQAGWIGEAASRGCSYGQGYGGVPFQRMPNVSLQPGSEGHTTEDLINATEKGVLVSGRGSWSIDHQRHNFQFGGQMFWKIEKGRLRGVLRDVAYQANTLEFWKSCDMLGGKGTYRLGGSMGDGKGEPSQSNAVSHGCPPARFTATVIRTGGDT
jgi:TldD protein